MATSAALPLRKLSSQSPPFNPNRILLRDQSNSPVPPQGHPSHSRSHSYASTGHRSRSSSPYLYHNNGGGGGGSVTGVSNNGTPVKGSAASGGGVGRGRMAMKYPTNPNAAHSNAIPKHTFEHNGETLEIRNVWAENVEEEMRNIRDLVEHYPYVAMDTEFPGVVAKPVMESYTTDYHYKSLKVNVDLLKIIQLGLSFSDEHGQLCSECPCWQFNFAFDLEGDLFAQDSIDLLVHSGISFPDHARRGIDPQLFGELLMVSGLVLDERVKWVTYHAGYDFAYLLKILTSSHDLPKDEKGFFELLNLYFPTVYDLKYMTSLVDNGRRYLGGLQRLADDLGCQRLGAEHQAGSDSLLTKDAFFALIQAKFQDSPPPQKDDPNDNNNNNKVESSSSLLSLAKKLTGNDDSHSSSHYNKKHNSHSSSASWFDDTRFANELYGYGNNHTVRKGPAAHVWENSGEVGGSGIGASNSTASMTNHE
mmetsp:Transcript_52730/g.59843  ORF Transcript_52730/g.59843 Transcript_52730/m.59843 type:complete len:477 (+) Transcript_52730:579-2009(+)